MSINQLKVIAHIHTDFPTKFGIPRQSGLINSLRGRIVFEPDYRNPDALRGLDGYSHIWLIWGFSESVRDTWSPTVRPPRLGGNTRMGVFATRSPFRPNSIGLSSVLLEEVQLDSQLGPVIYVLGADLMDNSPIYDIKPYLPHIDSHPEAKGGFADSLQNYALKVVFPTEMINLIPIHHHESLLAVLSQDPRPSYQNDASRIYGFEFAGFTIKFKVVESVLTVIEALSKR